MAEFSKSTIAERLVEAAYTGREAKFADSDTSTVYDFTPNGLKEYFNLGSLMTSAGVDQAIRNKTFMFNSVAEAQASTIPNEIEVIEVRFHNPSYAVPSTLVGRARYRRARLNTEINTFSPSLPSKAYFRTLDRFVPEGGTSATNGGYWLLDSEDVYPEHMGAIPDNNTDAKQAFLDAILTAYLLKKRVYLTGRAGYRIVGKLPVDYSVRIVGESKLVQVRIINSNSEEGFLVRASNVTFENFDIRAAPTSSVTNGTGHCGTCITISVWFTPPDQPEPPRVENTTIRNMILSRQAGSGNAHALSCMARTRGVTLDTVLFLGGGLDTNTGSHGNAILFHWGAWTHGVSTGAIKYTGGTGTPTAGATVTGGTSGATGYIVEADTINGILFLKEVSGTFQNGETLTTSGFSATSVGILYVTALDFDNQTSNFVVGGRLTGGTSGAQGTIAGQVDNGSTGTLFLTSVIGTFRDDEIITGSTGGSAQANGVTYSGLRQAIFEPGHYSHHPSGLRARNLVLRNTGRLIACSSSYDISIDGVDYEGGAQGGQLVDLPIGDECDTFAHPDDQGRVYSNFSFRNITANNITGSGANAQTAIDCSGLSTSKQSNTSLAAYASAPYTTEAYAGKSQKRVRAAEWKNVLFENFIFDFGPRTPPSTERLENAVYLRNLNGQFIFRNFNLKTRPNVYSASGVPTSDTPLVGMYFNNCQGRYRVEDSHIRGGIWVEGSQNITFENSLIEKAEFTSGYHALQVQGAIKELPITSAAIAKDDTSISLTAGAGSRIMPGARISYSGGVVYVTENVEAADTIIYVTPAPASAASGIVCTVDQRSRNIQINGCDIRGGNRGLYVAGSLVTMRGGSISRTGQYGAYLNRTATGDYSGGVVVSNGKGVLRIEGVTFFDNGWRKIYIPADSGVATRDLIVSWGHLSAHRNVFEESRGISNSFVTSADVDTVIFRDNVFLGTATKTSIAVPTNGKPIRFQGNVDGNGNAVYLSGTFTPVFRLGGSTVGWAYSTQNGAYTVYEDRVHFDIDMNASTKGSGTGAWSIAGFPFTQSGACVPTIMLTNATGLTGAVGGVMTSNVLSIRQSDATGFSNITDVNATNTSRAQVTGTYRISA